MKSRSLLTTLALVPVAGLLLSGCSTQAQGEPETSGLNIVATTNVYAQIAEAVAGEHATVNEIITSTAQDPHSYEPTARDKLTISNADIVVANGGGYDTFMDTLVQSLPKEQLDQVTLLHVVDTSPVAVEETEDHDHAHEEGEEHAHEHDEAEEHAHEHAEYNEHVWYDLESMSAFADALAAELGKQDAANAQAYADNAKTFDAGIDELSAQLAATGLSGKSYLMTEPVPFHLLGEAGMVNKTPEGLSEAIEEGEGITPLTLKNADDLLTSKGVDLMVYNAQTESNETQSLRSAAQDSGVPVVELTETITDDSTYLDWMRGNIESLASALKG
ncbi:metal ABC transporter solute-binding protein, Zn/Mn family [Glutamicibacter sp. NPDC087344]|uniref:metal ABC transporter solute-binding protein, Zn/Mn family n=1 Tax=Glutamicibacter sp. NPDC087344 TaxID=3363994 RepID=UPI003805ADBC